MTAEASSIVDVTKVNPAYDVFECMVQAEEKRRARQRNEDSANLNEKESTYFGPEVGHIRRSFNRVLLRSLKIDGLLLDYGCGGAWWKDDYWPGYEQVVAAEVDRDALREIGDRYPEVTRWHTRNGIIESSKRFDVILSSSVLGYILPVQGDHHIQSCAELLKDGGQLVVTRVLAFNLWAFLRSKRLVDIEGTSFAYHYSKNELVGLIKKHGFRDIRHFPLGVRLPLLSWKANQSLYRLFPSLMCRWLPVLFPFLRIQHMVVATK